MKESAWSSLYRTFKVSGSLPTGRSRKTWNEVIKSDPKEKKVSKNIAIDRNTWKSFMKNRPTHASMENRR